MHSKSTYASPFRRLAGAAFVTGAVFAAVLLGACSDFLSAENPAAVETGVLEDSSFVDLMANSAINSLQAPNPFGGTNDFWLTYLGAIFTDELRNHHVFADEILYDQRRVTVSNSYNNIFTYGPIQRGRWLADSLAARMRIIYPDSSLHDVRLARTYAIAGYHLIHLAEGWCEVPIAPAGQRYGGLVQSDSLFRLAEIRFDSAIKVAIAAKTANAPVQTPAGQRFSLAADSIRNFALVGMARAALGRNDKVKAALAARQVAGILPGNDFEYRLFHNSNTTSGLQNIYQDRLSGGGGVTSGSISGTPFFALDDARVPHPINATTGAPLPEAVQGTGSFVVPNSPPSHSTFSGTKIGADFSYGGSIRIASLLEARYILAEAEGPTGTNIAFIESRRLAFPSTTAQTPTTSANFLANLIDQRRRDFYLDGHRMGDLRRYKRLYNLDFYPKGPYLGSNITTYGDVMCWPINFAEITNNPLVPKPYNPPTGP